MSDEANEAPWSWLTVPTDEMPIRTRLHENGLSVWFEIFGAWVGEPGISDEEELMVQGFLKWDGCMNWNTDPDCMAHFCGPEGAERLARAFVALWRAAPVLMGDRYVGERVAA